MINSTEDGHDDVLSERAELVGRVFDQVQTEFATWNVVHCHQTLASFTGPSSWRSCLHPDLRSPRFAFTEAGSNAHAVDPVASEANSPPPLVSQVVYSPDGAVIEASSMKLDVIHVSSSLEPHPQYESCSPLHRSVFKGDDSDDMCFIPYADDPTFDQIGHIYHYGSFSWQNVFDPDLEVTVLETVYRLRTQHTLTYDEIEGCNVLPLKLRSRLGKSGVLSTARRRDLLHWTGSTIPASYNFPSSTQPEGSGILARIKALNSLFCPNLSCVEPFCSVHVELNLMPPISQPPASHVRGEVTNPCQNQCFISKAEESSPSWDEADLDTFKVVSELVPNTTPCDLAEICLKPCFEVFYYRKLLHPSNSVGAQSADTKCHRRMLRFNDDNPMQFTPNNPCHHTGPCSSSSGCPCFKNQSHCQRNCHCPPECNRRWQGCRCPKVKSKWSCATERCPCVEALRECDPELCINCECIDTQCRNSQLQRGARKEVEIKRSSWGLGTFLAEPARADDLISEYVGEVIYEPTVESRGDTAVHRNRCYVFGLNNTFSLDSTYAGNVSRFIDHSDAERCRRASAQARVRLVNGDHRIGIFAIRDIEAGSEVLMNYGSRFFIK